MEEDVLGVNLAVSVLTSFLIIFSSLLFSRLRKYVALGLIPITEELLIRKFPKYVHHISFPFWLFRLGVLVSINQTSLRFSDEGLSSFLDTVTIISMGPGLLRANVTNVGHIFLFIIVEKLLLTHDDEPEWPLRYVIKLLSFFTICLIGLCKHYVLERLHKNMKLHIRMLKHMDRMKKFIVGSLRKSVGWEEFQTDYAMDLDNFCLNHTPSLSKSDSDSGSKKPDVKRMKNQASLHYCVLDAVVLGNHNMSNFRKATDATRKFCKLSRTDSVVVAIRPFADDSYETQTVHNAYKLARSIHDLANRHNMSVVRRYGNVWIACSGVISSEFGISCRRFNECVIDAFYLCQDIFEFGKDVNVNFCCAVDGGNIAKGVCRGIFDFEVLGSEVMWVLSVCEFERKCKIFVSRSLHSKATQVLRNSSSSVFRFQCVTLRNTVWLHSDSCFVLIEKDDENKEMLNKSLLAKHHSVSFESVTSNFLVDKTSVEWKVGSEAYDWKTTLRCIHNVTMGYYANQARFCFHRVKRIFKRRVFGGNGSEALFNLNDNNTSDVYNEILKMILESQSSFFEKLYEDYEISHTNEASIWQKFVNIMCGRGRHAQISSAEDSSKRKMTGKEAYQVYRSAMLKSNGIYVNLIFITLLLASIWSVYALMNGKDSDSEFVVQFCWGFSCVFIVFSFFNWAVPLRSSGSLLLPVLNILFAIAFSHSYTATNHAMAAVLPTWAVLCSSHQLQSMTVSVVASLIIQFTMMMNRSSICVLTTFLVLGAYFLIALFLLEYIVILSYSVEAFLLPYDEISTCHYNAASSSIHNQFNFLLKVNPAEKAVKECISFDEIDPHPDWCKKFRYFERCVVVAIHIKGTETFPGVGSVNDVSNILLYIYSLFYSHTERHGVVGLSIFSGTIISVMRENTSQDSSFKRGVDYVKSILQEFRKLEQRRHVNFRLGICLNYGPANIGLFEDNERVFFDIAGTTRDIALQMAVKQENDIIFAPNFLKDIKAVFPNKRIESFVDGKLPPSQCFASSNVYWYQLKSFDMFNFAGNFGFSRNMKDYNYKEFLGKGGHGSVHLLEEKVNKVQVAVKIIEWRGESTIIDHIRQELLILQNLKHPNIVKIKFCVFRRPEMCIVMEYIRGGNLQQIVDLSSPSTDDLCVWFMQLVLALEYIHKQGIIHRDVKPSNCMIDTFKVLKLTDFGLALQDLSNAVKIESIGEAKERKSGVNLNPSSLRLLQSIFPSSVQYNTEATQNTTSSKNSNSGILLIDNDWDRLENTQELLRRRFIVYSVNNDDEALDFLTNRFKDNEEEANSICLIMVTVDITGDDNNGWGFLSILWNRSELKSIPIVSLIFSTNNRVSGLWRERLPFIEEFSRKIMYHPFNEQAYEANRSYLELICESEKHRKKLGKTSLSTVFDKMLSKKYDDSKLRSMPIHTDKNKKRKNIVVSKMHAVAGTVSYMAPEVVNREVSNEKIDWWSTACLFYYCYTKRLLFSGFDRNVIMEDILSANIDDLLKQRADLPDDLRDLLRNMLKRNANKRFGSSEIKKHKYFRKLEAIPKNSIKKEQISSLPST